MGTRKFKISIGVKETELLRLLLQRITASSENTSRVQGKLVGRINTAMVDISKLPDVGLLIEELRQELGELDERHE